LPHHLSAPCWSTPQTDCRSSELACLQKRNPGRESLPRTQREGVLVSCRSSKSNRRVLVPWNDRGTNLCAAKMVQRVQPKFLVGARYGYRREIGCHSALLVE
jgi:hypothetical protein